MAGRAPFRVRMSLRQLILVVTALCLVLGWLSRQLKWIQDRHEALEDPFNMAYNAQVTFEGDYWLIGDDKTQNAPWSIRLLGQQGVCTIFVASEPANLRMSPGTVDQKERQRWLEGLFPEAEVLIRPLPSP